MMIAKSAISIKDAKNRGSEGLSEKIKIVKEIL